MLANSPRSAICLAVSGDCSSKVISTRVIGGDYSSVGKIRASWLAVGGWVSFREALRRARDGTGSFPVSLFTPPMQTITSTDTGTATITDVSNSITANSAQFTSVTMTTSRELHTETLLNDGRCEYSGNLCSRLGHTVSCSRIRS